MRWYEVAGRSYSGEEGTLLVAAYSPDEARNRAVSRMASTTSVRAREEGDPEPEQLLGRMEESRSPVSQPLPDLTRYVAPQSNVSLPTIILGSYIGFMLVIATIVVVAS